MRSYFSAWFVRFTRRKEDVTLMQSPAPREKVSSIDVGPETIPCSSENFDRFMGPLLSCETAETAILLQFQAVVLFGGDVTHPPALDLHHPANTSATDETPKTMATPFLLILLTD